MESDGLAFEVHMQFVYGSFFEVIAWKRLGFHINALIKSS